MGLADVVTKEYMREPHVFADAFNFLLYDGRQVIKLVVHFGADSWDRPMSLHEMFSVQNDTIRRYAQDYRLHLLDPGRIPQKEFKKFASSLWEVLNYIKYSKDEKGLARLLAEDERLKALEAGAARVIETITHTDFAIDEKTEVVDVCQAVEDMMKTREQKGRELGEEIGRKQGQQQGSLNTLIQLVRKGLLSVADAASEAGLSCEAFEQQMKTQKF